MRGYKAHTIRDQLRFLSNVTRLQVPAFQVLSRIQDHTPGEQLLGTAIALRAMCESAGINLDDVMFAAGNAMADANGPYRPHLRAIRDYAANEIARGEEHRSQ